MRTVCPRSPGKAAAEVAGIPTLARPQSMQKIVHSRPDTAWDYKTKNALDKEIS
jgi:hypothetical protein